MDMGALVGTLNRTISNYNRDPYVHDQGRDTDQVAVLRAKPEKTVQDVGRDAFPNLKHMRMFFF